MEKDLTDPTVVNMHIKILFDSMALDRRFLTGWGISYLVDNGILFDTGEEAKSLLRNMENMDVKISDIKAIVISHDHWDHTGGLWRLLEENPRLKVYACPHFNRRFVNRVKSCGGQLIEADRFIPISKNVYTTGEIEGRYSGIYMPEQSLVLKTNKGIIIITGCAHPGIIKIIENVKQNIAGDIYLVLGGFHLEGERKEVVTSIVSKFKQLGIKRVGPSHCTGEIAIRLFEEEYEDDFIKVKVGQIIEV